MESDELILSDIHLNKVTTGSAQELHVTRFKYFLPCEGRNAIHEKGPVIERPAVVYDDDGDFVRSGSVCDCDVIRIYHRMSTNLSLVGLQVWRGALLMCDFITHNRAMFAHKHVLELGSGTGLTGIVAGQYAHRVTCSDVGDDVIEVCQKNISENSRLSTSVDAISVVELDWFKDHEFNFLPNSPDIIIVADCVYDNNLTEALFRTLRTLVVESKKRDLIVLISLEKRFNFTMDELDVTCREYNNFRTCLKRWQANDDVIVEQLDVAHLPSYFEYDRTKFVELWQIRCVRS